MDQFQYQMDLLKAKNQQLNNNERMYRLLVEQSSHAYLFYSFKRNQIFMLGLFREYFDFELKTSSDLSVLIDAMDHNKEAELIDVFYPERSNKLSGGIVVADAAGKEWYKFDSLIVCDGDEPSDKIIKISRVTAEQKSRNELMYLAYYDGLTGVYNRNHFIQLVGDFINRASLNDVKVSIINIDIDDFKKVYDGLGIMVGDDFLRLFGEFLSTLSNERVLVSHLSNDVFCICIYNPIGEYSVENIRRKILARLDQPFNMKSGQEIYVTVSMSVAEYPEAGDSALDLINCADIVIYKCKSNGKSQFNYFKSSMLADFLTDIDIENRLKDAILRNNFIVYFQPQYHSESKKLRGMEALVRWRDDDKGLIPPSVFIPLAEKNGSIIPIGAFVLDESIRRYADWNKKFNVDFVMSINISALQYKKDDFVDNVISVIKKYEVNPSQIELEITESILIDDFEAVTEKLRVLRDYGVRISLDDFGTGYSSLSYLKKFPIDTIKIDKTFIDTVLADSSTRIITESILNMSRNMGFESIAEGVENENQYMYLNEAGCDVIQGFYFGKPAPAESIDMLLNMISK